VRPDVHLTPGCPWWAASELRLPNVDWCEAQRCSWIVEPANTWSNLGYVLVGALLWWLARRSRSRALRAFGPAALLVGLASGVYHASYTFVLQILDFFGMYVFCYLLLTLNLVRLGLLAAEDRRRRYWQLVAATTAATVAIDFLEIPIQGVVLLLILSIVATEAWIRTRERYPLRFFLLSLACIAAGAVFSALDLSRTWCDPWHPVLQGHAIWHALSAASLLAAFLHYRQFEARLG
jgi:hypothetical protein